MAEIKSESVADFIPESVADFIRNTHPNEAAIVRLVGAILLEQNDEWAVQRARYMTLETISTVGDDPAVNLPELAG